MNMPVPVLVTVLVTVVGAGLGPVALGTHGAPWTAVVLAVIAVVGADLPARFVDSGRFAPDRYRAQLLSVCAVLLVLAVAVDLRP